MMSCNDATNLPPVIFTIHCTDFPVPPKYYIQKVRVHPWGWFPNLAIAGNLGLLPGGGRPLQVKPHH